MIAGIWTMFAPAGSVIVFVFPYNSYHPAPKMYHMFTGVHILDFRVLDQQDMMQINSSEVL